MLDSNKRRCYEVLLILPEYVVVEAKISKIELFGRRTLQMIQEYGQGMTVYFDDLERKK